MKNDYSFKFVAAIILAGVIIALVSPSHPNTEPAPAVDSTPVAAHATE